MGGKIELKGLFEGLQKQMIAQLNTNREFIEHPGSKGDSLEVTWIEWLRTYLPNRYRIDKAIIIDHEGTLGNQIDLVIYDQQFTPFVLTQNGVHYIPAEGVYAVFEVKPDLNGSTEDGSYIEYAGKKIESVRKLKRTSTFIVDRGTKHRPKTLTKIVGGVLASTNTMKKLATLEDKFKKVDPLGSIDMGCAVDFGCFFVDYEGEEDQNIQDLNSRISSYYLSRKIKGYKYSEESH